MTTRDIRSFLTKSPKDAATTRKPKPKRLSDVLSDDDDDDAKTQSPRTPQRGSKKSRRRHALSDSEDEAFVPKRKEVKVVKETVKEEKLKPVAVSDVFGKKAISRRRDPVILKKLDKKVAEIHNDDEFDASLIQLDISNLESNCLSSPPMDNKSNGKRKHAGESDEDVKAKKLRRDASSEKKKEEEISVKRENERKASSGDEKKTKARKTEKIESKSVKRETSLNRETESKDESKTSNNSDKLKFHKLQKNKKTEIVIEPKEESKKNKEKRKEEAADQYADAIEKKKERSFLYNKYLQRGGARNPGSKPIPTGAENCLAGLTFLITGVLDSLEREEAEDLIKQYGGRTVASVSKKTNYLVVGEDAGPSKLSKAADLGIKQISEDQLLDLIRTRPASKFKDFYKPRDCSTKRKRSKSPEKFLKSPSPEKAYALKKPAPEVEELPSTSVDELETKAANSASTSGNTSQRTDNSECETLAPGQALVDKYKPKSIKQIIGQHGEQSNARKLYKWLSNWHKNQSGDVKHTKPNPYAKNSDGASFKACLLSGPPGIGKTTTAQVVCAELQLDLLEFNASDTRSKRLLKEEISGILSNTTIKGYFTNKSKHELSKKHVLLMDEVDGMAGNEDRGGLQELIALIKSSEVPVICICNDRSHPKMKTLSNYTFDLRFQKPRFEQIKGSMKSLCCKEKIDISSEDLEHLITSTNQDIRQVINHLAMLTGGTASQRTTEQKRMNKDLKLGPWDVIQKVFSAEEHKKMSIHDKSDLFFHDYNIGALFVQENYLSVQPAAPKNQLLWRVARAADSLAAGDVIEKAIRGNGAWSLLSTQACFSSVIPGSLMSGRMTTSPNFPAWLGRNSRRGKFDRLLQEITVHARLVTGASKEAINIDYLNHLRDAIVRPLVLQKNEGIDEALNVMNHYHLLREDLESLMEISLWPGQQDPMQAVESKVKAAFTRAYNKSSAPAPYLMKVAAPKKKTAQASQDEGFMEGMDEEDDIASDVDNDDMVSDRMIKAKKVTARDKTARSSKTEGNPKAKRGRGRGKAK